MSSWKGGGSMLSVIEGVTPKEVLSSSPSEVCIASSESASEADLLAGCIDSVEESDDEFVGDLRSVRLQPPPQPVADRAFLSTLRTFCLGRDVGVGEGSGLGSGLGSLATGFDAGRGTAGYDRDCSPVFFLACLLFARLPTAVKESDCGVGDPRVGSPSVSTGSPFGYGLMM